MVDNNLVGGIPTPLKNMFVRQLGWLCPTEWNVIKFHGSKAPDILRPVFQDHRPVGTFIRSMAMYFMARCALVDETFVFLETRATSVESAFGFLKNPVSAAFLDSWRSSRYVKWYIYIYMIWYIYIYDIWRSFSETKHNDPWGLFSMSGCFTATWWGYPETWRSLLNERLSCWIAKSFNPLLSLIFHW